MRPFSLNFYANYRHSYDCFTHIYSKNSFFIAVLIITLLSFTSCIDTTVEIIDSPSAQFVPKKKPVVRVFLENSGSMDGFMCDGSELKDGIYNYLTSVQDNASKMELYYINSDTLRQNVTLSQYIKNLNPRAFKDAGGNRKFTQIPSLFTNVLNHVSEDTIAIYISDCILDTPNHVAPNYLYITRTDIHSVFGNKISSFDNLSVFIYQLESSFNGTFFFPRGGSQSYKGKLPYYMFVIGSNIQLANLRKNIQDDKITHGVKNYCAFSPVFEAPTVLLKGNRVLKSSDVLELKTKQRDGKYHFKVKTDLSLSLQNDSILTNPRNYTHTNPNYIQIEEILPIKVQNKEYSHIIEFSISDKAFGNIVTLNPVPLPSWVKESNDIHGSNINPDKTFGIEFIIGGITDAFNNKSTTSFKLNIKK